MPQYFVTNPLGFSVKTSELEDGSVTVIKTSFSTDLPITSGDILVDNAKGLKAEDSGGTSRNLICLNASNQLNIGANVGVVNMRLSTTSDTNNLTIQSGNVGVGVGVASEKFHLVGSLRMVDTNEAAGKLMQSDGDGVASWQTIAAALESAANVGTWSTQFSTTSVTYVDVTSATVTLSGLTASKTYTLMAFANIIIQHQNSASIATAKLLIDGSDAAEIEARDSSNISTYSGNSMSGLKASVTGATSYIGKVQLKTNNASFAALCNPATVLHSIILMAIEE